LSPGSCVCVDAQVGCRGAELTGEHERAAAAIFAIGHPETYRALVLDGDWDLDAWASWLQATLEAALVGTQ
jgi:hypothetical protein